MRELKGKREKDINGRWYKQTEHGRIYERTSKKDLIDQGFHNYSGKQD